MRKQISNLFSKLNAMGSRPSLAQTISTFLYRSLFFGVFVALATSMMAQTEDASDATEAPAASAEPTQLALINGWYNAPYSTSNAEVQTVSGIVHFKGAIASIASDSEPFVLPKAFRPKTDVYIPVDLCNAQNGRLYIQPSGDVYIQSENSFTNAECFTSLDGASFALNGSGYTELSLINGWYNAPYSTSNAEVKKINGVVHFKGALASIADNAEAFVLPKAYWPKTYVYIPVDLCNATNGRLYIQPTGEVYVQAETYFSNAECFTSLDGAWFVASDSGAKALDLVNGWIGAPYGTSAAKAEKSSGIVYFQGSIETSGDYTEPLVLPSSMIPQTSVYVPVDLCNATKGRLYIQPNGVVTVQAETTFADAQCFTSLDGVSFVQ
jgi:hypothetical protein